MRLTAKVHDAAPPRHAVRPEERFAIGLAAAGLALAALDTLPLSSPSWYVGGTTQAALHGAFAGGGALALLAEGDGTRRAARAIGVALLALAALGTLTPGLIGLAPRLGLAFQPLENLAHAALGAWGVYAARRKPLA